MVMSNTVVTVDTNEIFFINVIQFNTFNNFPCSSHARCRSSVSALGDSRDSKPSNALLRQQGAPAPARQAVAYSARPAAVKRRDDHSGEQGAPAPARTIVVTAARLGRRQMRDDSSGEQGATSPRPDGSRGSRAAHARADDSDRRLCARLRPQP